MLNIMIIGAGGRMGREVIRAAVESPDVRIAAAVDREKHPELGRDAGLIAGLSPIGVALTGDPAAGLAVSDAVIDFSSAGSTLKALEALARQPRPAVIGTTGLDDRVRQAVGRLALAAPVLLSPNLSYGVAVLKRLAKEAARLMPRFDVEIMEIHHQAKADAPSGTAVALLGAIQEVAGVGAQQRVVLGRSGRQARRQAGEIGVHALRGGSVTGEHTVFFFGDGERIELRHAAENRKIFALGSLDAARRLIGKPAGLYTLDDLLA